MTVLVPVYSNENNLHYVGLYAEEPDGTFIRTQAEPLRSLRDNIEKISTPQGELISVQHDKYERQWTSPTITFHYGRPQSYFQFMREMLERNRFYVLTKPSLSGRVVGFELHELRLKFGTSQRILSLLKEKFSQGINLWTQEEYEQKKKHNGEKQKKDAIKKLTRLHAKPKRSESSLIDSNTDSTTKQPVKKKKFAFVINDNTSNQPLAPPAMQPRQSQQKAEQNPAKDQSRHQAGQKNSGLELLPKGLNVNEAVPSKPSSAQFSIDDNSYNFTATTWPERGGKSKKDALSKSSSSPFQEFSLEPD